MLKIVSNERKKYFWFHCIKYTAATKNITIPEIRRRSTRWRSCFRHCTANLKVAGSIPDGVIGIFLWHNPWPRCWLSRCMRLTILPPSYADCFEIWEPQLPGTLWARNWPVWGLISLIKKESSIKLHFVLHRERVSCSYIGQPVIA